MFHVSNAKVVMTTKKNVVWESFRRLATLWMYVRDEVYCALWVICLDLLKWLYNHQGIEYAVQAVQNGQLKLG